MYTRGDIPQFLSGENYLKRVPGEHQDELWDHRPIAHLDRLRAKVMLIVGGADSRVPPVRGGNLQAALLKRKVVHEWLYDRTEGHGFYREDYVTELYQPLPDFLDAMIGARPQGQVPPLIWRLVPQGFPSL
jgi:dipeptidyl aminopeptidase/acylaminoacyl peptidase